MRRKCSQCGIIGHNLRTCSSKNNTQTTSFKLFGVQLNPTSSSSSLSLTSSSSCNWSTSSGLMLGEFADKFRNGYASDDQLIQQDRKKGIAWTTEEHKQFLLGLEKYGKGDWKAISRYFVTTRSPTQIASHAQKFYLRQFSLTKRKRPSLFDMKTCQSPFKNVDYSCGSGFTSNATKQASLADDFRSIKWDPFSSDELDLELKLAASVLHSKVGFWNHTLIGYGNEMLHILMKQS